MSTLSVFEVQPVAMRILQAATERDRISHAYLFHGPEGTGKWQAAHTLARWLLCPEAAYSPSCECAVCRRIERYQHPDVHWILPLVTSEKAAGSDEKATEEHQQLLDCKRADPWAVLNYPRRPYITAKRIRNLQSELARTAVEGGRKIGVIINAEHLRQDVQSILLKTIEEPPRDTHLILTTNERSTLLPTILSRCQRVRFAPLSQAVLTDQLAATAADTEEIPLAVTLAGGSLTRAGGNLTEEGILWRNTAWALLRIAILGTPEDLLANLDEVLRRRPDMPVMLRFVDVWNYGIHRVLVHRQRTAESTDYDPLDDALFAGYRRLGVVRAALNGNVTPRVALAAAMLEVQSRLAPFRRQVADWFPETITATLPAPVAK